MHDHTDLPIDVRAIRAFNRLETAGAPQPVLDAAWAIRMAVRGLVGDGNLDAAQVTLDVLLGMEAAR